MAFVGGGEKNPTQLIGVAGALGLIGFFGLKAGTTPPPAPVAPKTAIGRPFSEKEIEAPKTFQAHVSGTVRKPGVIEFPAGERVHDLVKRAGGTLPGTDLSNWNLAKKVGDGDALVFAMREAPIEEAPVGEGPPRPRRRKPTRTRTRVRPRPEPLAPLPLPGNFSPERASAPRRTTPKAEPRIVSLNTGLQAVPGIGPKKLAKLRPYVRL